MRMLALLLLLLRLDCPLGFSLALADLPLVICAFLHLLLVRNTLVLLDAPPKEAGIRAEPFVRHNGLQIGTVLRVWYKHLAQEIARLDGNIVGESELCAEDILVQEVDIVSFGIGWIIVERQVTREHRVQNNATGPDVYCRAYIESLADDQFGGSITWATTTRLHQVIGLMLKAVGKPKVGDDHVPVSVEEQVFEFEVTVDDLFLVEVPDGGDELSEQLASVPFFEVAVGEDMIEEFTAGGIFEDDPDVLVRFDNIIEVNDIWVIK